MVRYFASAATIVALTSISATTIQAEELVTNLRRIDQRVREHYGGGDFASSHFVSDTVTDCEEVMVGNPPICVNVCVEVTSITNDGMLVEETSKASQRKCKSTNMATGSDSSKSSNSRNVETNSWYGGARNIVGDSSKANKEGVDSSKSSKFQSVKNVSTSNSWNGSAQIAANGSSKAGKNKVASGGGGVGSGKSSKIVVVNDVQSVSPSDGWSGSAHTMELETLDDDNWVKIVRAQITKLVKDSDRELIPKFLRLGFHDCVGGCDGCIDLTNTDNKGLYEPINALYPIVEKFKDSLSRADVWALAALVSADLALVEGRPAGLQFPMRYIGRKDCEGANAKGIGGPDFVLPSSHVTTHELLGFFKEKFNFDTEETVIIMGVHAVATLHREISGFGVKDEEFGWVFNAKDYMLDNRYYNMLVGDKDPVTSAPLWQGEVVHNEGGIPSRYQWIHKRNGEDEQPIMTSADIALVRDLSGYMHDENGVEGIVECVFKAESGAIRTSNSYTKQQSVQKKTVCPVASETLEFMIEYKNDNELWLIDFERVLEKMLTNGYEISK